MLKNKLQVDMKEAMKAGNATKRLVLSLLQSAIKNRELEKRNKLSKTPSTGSGQAAIDPNKLEELSQLSDGEVIDVISSEVKKRKESIEIYEKAGREELAQKERNELDILMEYMLEQMSEGEIREIVRQAIKEMALPAGALAKAGQVIGFVMPKLKGRADGQTVSRIVKEELSG